MPHVSACIAGIALIVASVGGGRQTDAREQANFTILLRGVAIGTEMVRVSRTGAGWLISSTGRQGAPIDLVTSKFEMTYGPDWQPQSLSIEATRRGQLMTLDTSFGLTTAISDMLVGGQKGSVTHQVSPRTIVLPNNFFGAYEALAGRLGTTTAGTRLPVYIAPQEEIVATVDQVTPRRVVTSAGPLELRQFDLTLAYPTGPLPIEMWVDASNRLARLRIPAASLALIREDIAAVTTREETIRNPGDEDSSIAANGFTLAATLTRPAGAPAARVPAVILVAGSGQQDRDETVFGIPMFGQLAGAIADAGFFVVRYDKRGLGQSGGRVERATLADYADDVVSVIEWLRKRKDVDGDRIALVGHSEGAAVAMIVASRGNHVAALALLAAPGLTGRGVVLWQQQHVLARSSMAEADKQARVALQTRLMDAVVSGTGWAGVPDELRQQADTAWFRSWLQFDPSVTLAKVNRPVLILHGTLDQQIPAEQADRLELVARSRKGQPDTATRKVIVNGVNHLLVASQTGEPDEYPRLPAKAVSAEVLTALTGWLREAVVRK